MNKLIQLGLLERVEQTRTKNRFSSNKYRLIQPKQWLLNTYKDNPEYNINAKFFSMLKRQIVTSNKLSDLEARLYMVLRTWVKSEMQLSTAALIKGCNCSRNSFVIARESLVQKGLISYNLSEVGGLNQYSLTIENEWISNNS